MTSISSARLVLYSSSVLREAGLPERCIALVNELNSSGAILRQKTDDRRRLLREELEDVEGR